MGSFRSLTARTLIIIAFFVALPSCDLIEDNVNSNGKSDLFVLNSSECRFLAALYIDQVIDFNYLLLEVVPPSHTKEKPIFSDLPEGVHIFTCIQEDLPPDAPDDPLFIVEIDVTETRDYVFSLDAGDCLTAN